MTKIAIISDENRFCVMFDDKQEVTLKEYMISEMTLSSSADDGLIRLKFELVATPDQVDMKIKPEEREVLRRL